MKVLRCLDEYACLAITNLVDDCEWFEVQTEQFASRVKNQGKAARTRAENSRKRAEAMDKATKNSGLTGKALYEFMILEHRDLMLVNKKKGDVISYRQMMEQYRISTRS